MLLNWQGRHFMEINHSRITSYEIADYMIRTKSLLSAKELAALLEKEYPHLDVDKRDVYLRLKAIAVSKYSSVLIDDSTNESVKITGQCWKQLNSSRRMAGKCRP